MLKAYGSLTTCGLIILTEGLGIFKEGVEVDVVTGKRRERGKRERESPIISEFE